MGEKDCLMLVNVYGAKCAGIEAEEVTVEVDIKSGVGIHLVGLADTAVKESLLRTVTALQSLGYHIPGKKIIINLAPADVHKTGSGYDLPIALGIIAASGQREFPQMDRYIVMGELGLDGAVRKINGALPFAELALKKGCKGCILPLDSAEEACELDGIDVYGVANMEDAVRVLEEKEDVSDLLVLREDGACAQPFPLGEYMDFSEIIGQQGAKRGAEIAAAGNHNLILVGPPGSGKSSLAKAMAGILPPMSKEESLVTSKIYSIAGKGDLRSGLMRVRPVRSPHYSASLAAILGGGAGDSITPGEISLAHGGILFIDEFGQMPKSVVQALRGPMEDRKIVISRLRTKVEYPASFTLVAASNPCPCGYWGDGDRCTCTPAQRSSYLMRLSGPIMERIDLHVWMSRVEAGKVMDKSAREGSKAVAERVAAARLIQRERFAGEPICTNAEMSNRQIARYCPLSKECEEVLNRLLTGMNLSMRAYFRIIKVARTIADLEGAMDICASHLMEAAGYRFLDKPGEL